MTLATDSRHEIIAPAGREKAAAIAVALRRAARQSRVPVMSISGGGGFRARRSDRVYWMAVLASFVIVVALPVLFATIYFGLYASDQYVSEIKLAVRSGETSILDSLGAMTGLPTSQQGQDTRIVVNYINSRAIVEKLDLEIDLRSRYSRPGVDWIARFDASGATEDLEKYWRNRVDVGIEPQSSIVSIQVRAFTPQDALEIARRVLSSAEELVNSLSERARADALSDASAELARAEGRLLEATTALRDERNRLGLLSGEATSLMVEKVVGALRMELARRQQDLSIIAKTARPDNPQFRILSRQIDNLNEQIASYMGQIANGDSSAGATLADRMEQLSRRQSDLDVAQKLYASAAVAYETARVDAESKHGYLLAFMQPTLAEKALYPMRWLDWFVVTVPALLIWAVLVGLGALVRDHTAS